MHGSWKTATCVQSPCVRQTLHMLRPDIPGEHRWYIRSYIYGYIYYRVYTEIYMIYPRNWIAKPLCKAAFLTCKCHLKDHGGSLTSLRLESWRGNNFSDDFEHQLNNILQSLSRTALMLLESITIQMNNMWIPRASNTPLKRWQI